jgi:biopolymer transport protein ExbD
MIELIMAWFNSIDILNKLIPFSQVLIVLLTIFTIWASVHRGKLEKIEKMRLVQEIQQTKKQTSEITKVNSSLEQALKNSDAELISLKKKTEPRKLSDEQKRKLLLDLPKPSFNIGIAAACRLMDNEGCSFADEIVGVFRELKWNVEVTNRSYLDDIRGDVAVIVTATNQIDFASSIEGALKKIGLIVTEEKIREGSILGIKPNTIYIIVGAKHSN